MRLNVQGGRFHRTALSFYFLNSTRPKAARLPRLDKFWISNLQWLERGGNIDSAFAFAQRGASGEE